MRAILAAIMIGGVFVCAVFAQANPYCVSGADWSTSGVMARLGMPSGTLGYIWDGLYATNLANMVRPCKYWLLVGGHHQAHGYHEDTDTIDDPAVFGPWVDAHPGKTWIIGNEPNLSSQDGLTTDQYARMFHTYYIFIRGRDPSAHLAVAGLAGSADAGSFGGQAAWWNAVLGSYRTQFGAEMPIDIWNCHGYAVVGSLDPDGLIANFFAPYRQYVDTVSGGIYASEELWCTEFGVAVWSAPLGMSYVNEFMQQLCPRLERSGVNRFFWFIGPWPGGWDASYNDLALLNASNQPTLIGQTYQQLAAGVPNPIPPPAPSQSILPWPPRLMSNDFGSTASPLVVRAGNWILDGGAYRQTATTLAWGTIAELPYRYRDFQLDVDVRINSAPATANWAGVTLRSGGIWTGGDFQTYLVFLRQSGELGLNTKADGTIITVPGVVSDTSVFHHLTVLVRGWHFEIRVDGVKQITWDDPNHRRSEGMITLYAGKTDCSYDNLSVQQLLPGDFDRDGDVDQSDFGHLQACFSGVFIPQTDSACADAYMDVGNDVDQDDFTLFQRCISGAGMPVSPDCAD